MNSSNREKLQLWVHMDPSTPTKG